MRMPIVLVMAAAIAVFAPIAQAAADSAVGAGHAPVELNGAIVDLTFDFNAASGPAGENPSGTFSYTIQGNTYAGPVVCLGITPSGPVGGVATIGFNDQTGEGHLAFAYDSGDPTRRDEFGVQGVDQPTLGRPATANDCVPQAPVSPHTVTAGDITVVDIPTQAQCRDDGYVLFGYGNQGQCISASKH
jgi:hypothetical protein